MAKKVENKKTLLKIAAGALTGAINGFFGGGGGTVVVPVLSGVLGYEQKKAQASCIAVILPVSVVSGAVYAFGRKVSLVSFLPVCLGVTLGGALGALLLKKVKSKILGYAFCLVMALAGIKLLF